MNPFLLYDNRYLDGTPAATDTATGYDVLNIRDLRNYTYWCAASFGTKYVTVDCGSAKAADSLAIIGHNLATAAATISVECSSDNFSSDVTVALSGFTVSDDRALAKTFATQTKRYWRLKLVTAAVAPYLAVVMIGARLDFAYPPDSPYDPRGEGIVVESTRSVAGNLLGSVISYYPVTLKARFRLLTRTFVEGAYKTFWDSHGKLLKPFFWVWDLTAYPTLVRFVKFSEKATFSTPVSYLDYIDDLTLDMEGISEP